jgi:hypothetical protein
MGLGDKGKLSTKKIDPIFLPTEANPDKNSDVAGLNGTDLGNLDIPQSGKTLPDVQSGNTPPSQSMETESFSSVDEAIPENASVESSADKKNVSAVKVGLYLPVIIHTKLQFYCWKNKLKISEACSKIFSEFFKTHIDWDDINTKHLFEIYTKK